MVTTPNTTIRMQMEELRRSAAECILRPDYDSQVRARGYLRMVEVLKVQLLARGEKVIVRSKEGTLWTR